MASGSCSGMSSDIRRLRSARLNFEAPSFSLGIDTSIFGSVPSIDEIPEGSSRRSKEVEENCKLREHVVVESDSEDDLQITGRQQQRSFKRLKHGPSSARKELLKAARDLPRKTDTSASRRSKELTQSITRMYKEPLPFAKTISNPVSEVFNSAGIDSTDFGKGYVRTGSGDRALPSASDHRSGQKRPESEPVLASEAVPKFGSQREGGSTGGGFSFNREPLPSVHSFRSNPPENIQNTPERGGDVVEEDDIEEFSDYEPFGFGSQTQRDRTSLRPDISGPTPILLSSSPETSQKSQKPVLHIPAVEFRQKVPLRLPIPPETCISEDDAFSIDNFVSESGWTPTKPGLSKLSQTPQPLKKPTLDSQTVNSAPTRFKTFHRDPFRETNFRSFHTDTPARRDIVGHSQAFSVVKVNQSEQDQIMAFLRQRFNHYKPVDALLVDGGLDNEPVYIDYERQFAGGMDITQSRSGNTSMGLGARWPAEGMDITQPQSGNTSMGLGVRRPAVRSKHDALSAPPSSIPAQRRNGGREKLKTRGRPKIQNPGKASSAGGWRKRGQGGGSGEGKWRTVNRSRVYIVGGQKMTGRNAYAAHKKRSASSSSKKSKKRPSTKSK